MIECSFLFKFLNPPGQPLSEEKKGHRHNQVESPVCGRTFKALPPLNSSVINKVSKKKKNNGLKNTMFAKPVFGDI